MKKIFVVLLTLTMLFSITSCIKVGSTAELQRGREEIATVEIYYLKEMCYQESLHLLREENAPIYILNEREKDGLLDELCKFKYEKTVILAPIPFDGAITFTGYVISVVYNDGESYELFAEQGIFSYLVDADEGERYGYDYSDYVGESDWSVFIESYIKN